MKLTDSLKKQAGESESREAKKAAIEDAGMLLTDDELDAVAGGGRRADCSYHISRATGVYQNYDSDLALFTSWLSFNTLVTLTGNQETHPTGCVMCEISYPCAGWIKAEYVSTKRNR